MNDLFDDLPKPDVDWYPDWLSPEAAGRALTQLIDEVAWKQESMGTPAGRVALPRLTACGVRLLRHSQCAASVDADGGRVEGQRRNDQRMPFQ
jgi:hypothetical protein